MPRSSNQKIKLSVLRSVLMERTSPGHPMTMKEIIEALTANGIRAERKSIYNDIETLRMLGTDIQTVRNKTVGYYVASREFEIGELKLLVDAVSSSRFIPESRSKLLIKKLTSLTDERHRSALNRSVFVSGRANKMDEDVLRNVDRIYEAIDSDVSISFSYFSWTPKKEKELRRNGRKYFISPWALIWDDGNYYLLGYDTEIASLRHYRIDKMIGVELTEEKRQGKEEYKSFDIKSYSGAIFGMFGGEKQKVRMRCANRLSNTMLDRFGKDTVILNDGDHFIITVSIVPSPVFLGWVLSFGGEVEILSPQEVADQLNELLEKF